MKHFRAVVAISSGFLIGMSGVAFALDETQSGGGLDFLEVENSEYVNSVNEEDELGNRVWFGEESPTVSAIAEVYSELTEEGVSNIVGAALTSDRLAIEVYVLDFEGEGVERLKAAAGDSPDSLILVRNEFSAEDYSEVSAVLEDAMSDGPINMIAPDPINDTYTVGIETDVFDVGPEVIMDEVEEKIADETGMSVVPSIVPADSIASMARHNDTSYFYAGAAIRRDKAVCTLGIPIVVRGSYYSITAGHCGMGIWRNGSLSNYVGQSTTTTWPNNAYLRGDFQVISGSKYGSHFGMNVFTGDRLSSTSYPITGGNFGTRAIGAELCASGAVTGTTCRYVVTNVNAVRQVGGFSVGELTIAYHDENRDKIRDCRGVTEGDSGGPVFYDYGNGKMMYAIVTGGNANCDYAFTQLSGVRKWEGTVQVG